MQTTRIGTLGATSSGVRFPLRAQNHSREMITAGSIDATFLDAVNGTEDTRLSFNVLTAGASATPMTVDGVAVNVAVPTKFLTGKDVVVGAGGLATTATAGFLFIPSAAGPSTGTPANTYTNCVALMYNRTDNKFDVYNGGWVHSAALT